MGNDRTDKNQHSSIFICYSGIAKGNGGDFNERNQNKGAC